MVLTMEARVLIVVFVALFIDITSFSMILPVFPAILDFYAKQPPENDRFFAFINRSVDEFREAIGAPESNRWNSVLFGGALGSLFCVLQYATCPLLGALSDFYGRRSILLLTTFAMGLSFAIWASATSFAQFIAARVLCGLSKGSTSVYSAVVTDVSGSSSRNAGMVVVGLAYSFGFIIGPMCGAWLSSIVKANSERFFFLPALVAMVLTFLDFIIIAVSLPETARTLHPANSDSKPTQKKSSPARPAARSKFTEMLVDSMKLIEPTSLFQFSAVRDANTAVRDALKRFGLSYFLFMVLFSGIEFNLTFLAAVRFSYDGMKQGRMFVFIGVLMILFQGAVVRRVRAGNEQRVAAIGMLLVVPSGLIFAFSTDQFYFYLALTLYSFSSASVVPCLTTCVSLYGGTDEKGKLIGILRSLGALARAIGPLLFASIFWLYGAQMAYAIAGVSMLLPIAVLYSIARTATELSSKNA